jgi:molybdenum cofactor sulfurtransferase
MDFKDEYSAEERLKINEEFGRLEGKHYLDHAGATLYAASQIKAVADGLTENLFCNPHTSKTTADLIDQVRFK